MGRECHGVFSNFASTSYVGPRHSAQILNFGSIVLMPARDLGWLIKIKVIFHSCNGDFPYFLPLYSPHPTPTPRCKSTLEGNRNVVGRKISNKGGGRPGVNGSDFLLLQLIFEIKCKMATAMRKS